MFTIVFLCPLVVQRHVVEPTNSGEFSSFRLMLDLQFRTVVVRKDARYGFHPIDHAETRLPALRVGDRPGNYACALEKMRSGGRVLRMLATPTGLTRPLRTAFPY